MRPGDQLPPHAAEAEQAVLGCCLLDPAHCIPETSRLLPDVECFYDMRNQVIFGLLIKMHEAKELIDLVTVPQRLKDRGLLQSAGGMAYVAELPDRVATPDMIGSYIKPVREKYVVRKLIQSASRILDDAYSVDMSSADMVETAWDRMNKLRFSSGGDEGFGNVMTPDDMMDFDTSHDPGNLIGRRYLCRGGSCLIIAPSGVGKSAIAQQLGIHWAVGRNLWGIGPSGVPLRVLIVQAENDKGDLAEAFQGITHGSGFDAFSQEQEWETLRGNLRIVSDNSSTGKEFLRRLRSWIQAHKADIVIIDPLLSFVGGDLQKTEVVASFFRSGLAPILAETGAAAIFMHHTPKPATKSEGGKKQGTILSDFAYAGLGSSDLTNFFRAVMTIIPIGEGNYVLKLAKRGPRAGATNLDGSPANEVWIRHAIGRIHWEQIEEPTEPEPKEKPTRKSDLAKIADKGLTTFVEGCTNEGEGLNDIARRLVTWCEDRKRNIDLSFSNAKKIVPLLVEGTDPALKGKSYLLKAESKYYAGSTTSNG